MTPEERALLDRAIEACGAGSAHAAERILLFPKIVDMITATVAREAIYRREHRIELRRRMEKVREVVWRAMESVDDSPAGSQYVREMRDALHDLLRYLQALEDSL